MINLRQAATPLNININNRPLELAEEADIANSSQFGRGWASASMNEEGAELLWKSNQAAIAGDTGLAQALRQQGEDTMRRAQAWAPTVQNFTDIQGPGDAVDWALGSAGNIRSSVVPALGGLAGGAVGAVGGGLVGGLPGAAAGATWGARTGAGLAGYDTMTASNAAQSMMDPTIAATRTPEEIRDVSRLTGAAQGALEAIVPAGMATSIVKGAGKKAAQEIAEQRAKKYIAKKAGKEGVEEFATEFLQNPIGDMGQNYLAGNDMTDVDWKGAFNAGMAGFAPGAMMGGVGATADVMHDTVGGAAKTVANVARDPVGAVIDKMKRGAEAAGAEQVGQDPMRDREMAGEMYKHIYGDNGWSEKPATLRGMHEEMQAKAQDDRFTSPVSKDLPDEQVSAQMRSEADRLAEKVLKSPPRTYGPHEAKLREAAAAYKSNGDWLSLRNVLGEYNLRKEQEDMSASFDNDGAKFSEMSDEGKELNSLSDAWLRNEGKRFGHYFDDSNEAKGLGAKIFGWIKSDFGKQYNDGEMFIPKAFVDALGERAPGVIESAITAARKEGWDIKDAGDAVKTLREYVASNEGDVGFLKGALKYSQEKNWTPKMMQQFSKELRQKQGRIDKEDYKWLKSQVTDPAAVLQHFQQPSGFYKADKNQLLRSGSPKTQSDMDVDGESLELSVDRDGEVVSESSSASAAITDNDSDWGSSVSEFDGDSKPTFIGNTLEGYPFDTTDERQVAKKNAKLGEYANDPAAFAREIGVWQQAKRAAKGNKALLTEYEDALIREHGNSLSDANFEGELNPVDLNEGERNSILSQINKRFRMVEVETTKSANDMGFDKKEVHLKEADPRDQELGPSKGILRFQRYNKDGSPIARPFVTSTQMLIGKMFKSKDSLTGSTKYYEGTAQQLLQHLSDGVATLLQDQSFGGEGRPAKIAFTVKADGTPRWVDAKDVKSWSKNVVLFRDKEGRQYTLGEALAQIEEQAKKSPKEMRNELRTIDWNGVYLSHLGDTSEGAENYKAAVAKARGEVKQEREKVSSAIYGDNDNLVRRLYEHYAGMGVIPKVPSFTLDFDPDTLNPHNKLTIEEEEPWEKAEDLKQLLNLSTDKELRGRIVRARKLAGKREFADSNALWKELVDSGKLQPAGIVTDVEVGRGNQVDEGQVGPDDLSAYDPDYIKRTDEGRMRSKSLEYEAQSVIGTSKKVDQKDAGKFDPALKGFPTLTSTDAQNLVAEKLQAAKDWVASVMLGGVEPLLAAIGKMDLQQVRITEAALFGRETVTERNSRVSDPNVSVKKADAAEIAELAKRVGVSRKVALAMLRREEKTVYTRVYDKDIGGVRTKDAGEAQTVTKQVGLLDLHQTKLAKQYFNGSLRDALAFLKSGQENRSVVEAAVAKRKLELKKGSTPSEGVQPDASSLETRVHAGATTTPDPQTAKQDAFVFKIANMSMKDMRAYVDNLPFDKLQRVWNGLDTFYPVDNENAFWQRHDLETYREQQDKMIRAAQYRIEDRLAEESDVETDGDTKYSEQKSNNPLTEPMKPDEAVAYLERVFGKDFDVEVVKSLGGKAGMWTPHGIKLATSAVNGVQYHEALHEFFSQLRKHGSESVAQLIERVATNPIIMRKLEQLLEGHPKALKQLKTPEEAAAFMFQFWNMGLINIGPETKSLFQTIKGFIAKVAKKLLSYADTEFRDKYNAEKRADKDKEMALLAFETLNSGLVADPSRRHEVYDALRKNVEAHNKAMDDLGSGVEKFWQKLGQVVVSNEAMLGLYKKHPELQALASKFHQTHGKSMANQGREGGPEARGGYLEATHTQSGLWLNKLENILDGYDQKDMELALKYLEEGTGNSADAKIAKLVNGIRGFYGEMYDYTLQSDVRRLDPTSELRWVPVDKRKDYFTQVWDTEAVMGGHDKFIEKLLTIHPKELKHMADQANAEIAAWRKNFDDSKLSPTAKVEVEKQKDAFKKSGKIAGKYEFAEITPEAVAETIYTRLLNSAGLLDIHESEWSLGITPGAAAVNRRELNWLDKEAFSEFKSKDLVNITTTYARSMVKRAEYQKRFGYGGELIGEAVDTALLRELGGNELVKESRLALGWAIKEWKKEAAGWYKDNPGVPYPEPYPTLRMVGIELHRNNVGVDAANEALIKAEKELRPAINAIKGMEGTLGADISPAMRNFNSWVTSYQNVRLLPFMLFTNLSDVIGITVQGGTLGDAWNAFVEGMREIRATWKGEKSNTDLQRRAQEWGVVDAGALLDSLGQAYGSVFMSQKAKRFNDKFFRIIGAEGWNRGIRATAANVGERIILDWVKDGVDFKKPGEKERFERLYGEGATVKSIKLDSSGNLDVNNAANRAAINRFVADAIMTSNAAHRTAWMSNPKFATFSHLKNFAYTFHRVMLLNVLDQARLGNFRPALVASLGYAPIAIAAGAIKEMLIPGEEPPWMQGGLDGYLEYGYGQANLGGVAQLWGETITDLDPAKMAGPFWDQIQNTISSPLPGIKLNLSPIDGETEILRDREWDVELAKALPAGNVLGRAFKG